MPTLDRIHGVLPAVLTPFNRQGQVNLSALGEFVEHLLGQGVSGFFVCGSTGEGVLQTVEERQAVAKTVVDTVRGRVPVMIHVGAPATETSIALARHAAEIGADAVASIPPPIYHHDTAAIAEHYLLIGQATDVPLYVYANPVSDPVGLMRRLRAEAPTLHGIKFTSHDLYSLSLIVQIDGGALNVLSGADEVALGALAMGAEGIIGSTYNALPGVFISIAAALKSGNVAEARRLQHAANRVIEVILRGPIIPRTKELVRLLGIDLGDARRPFRPLSDAERKGFREDVLAAGLADLAEVRG